jgi:hypothetical protein
MLSYRIATFLLRFQVGSMRHSGCRSVSLGISFLEHNKRITTRGGMGELYACKGGGDGDMAPWA